MFGYSTLFMVFIGWHRYQKSYTFSREYQALPYFLKFCENVVDSTQHTNSKLIAQNRLLQEQIIELNRINNSINLNLTVMVLNSFKYQKT